MLEPEGDGMNQRASRALRGTAAAVISTVIAATSHGLADGRAPSVVAVSVALTASVFVCIALAGKTVSRARLAVAVAFSQLAYHGMFAFAPSGGSVSSTSLGAHAQHTLGSIDVHAGAVAHGHSPAMWCAHILAGVVTTILLATGENVVHGLFVTVRLAVSTLFTHPEPVPIPRLQSLLPDAVAPRRAPVVDSSRSQRGPPALSLG